MRLPKIALFCGFFEHTARSRGSNHRGRYNSFLLGDTKESLIMSAYRIDITHEVKDICLLLFI